MKSEARSIIEAEDPKTIFFQLPRPPFNFKVVRSRGGSHYSYGIYFKDEFITVAPGFFFSPEAVEAQAKSSIERYNRLHAKFPYAPYLDFYRWVQEARFNDKRGSSTPIS